MSNRLSAETSPYLLQHKDNPVNWYPWCKEAFQKAKEDDKPIFLSIGYSTCHWCHVMARESFEDPKIAELLDAFICIKVDREERPDIDAVYMNVCQTLTGSGGWPLTIFMTAEQTPFFAGTYFPKTSRYGQTGLDELLQRILLLWHTERIKLLASGQQITRMLRQPPTVSGAAPQRSLLVRGYTALRQNFDAAWGGFGSAPKFPAPHNLLFLMRYYEAEQEPQALQMAERTLAAMAAGGIFDHIGGGFSRYSTDRQWLVPHFEKMLYDNALLLLAYLEGYLLTQNPLYADIAARTADYILRELTDSAGGFYCGQDADSDGVEGKYYVFTPAEAVRVLGREDGLRFCQMYNITEKGNFEGKSIPNRVENADAEWSGDDPRLLRLLEYRRKRTRLHLDHKILLSWNSWTILALTRASSILNDSRYLQAAEKAHVFIKERMTDRNNRLYLRFCDGEAAHAGQLEDYAVYTLALTELYRRTFEIQYLKEAVIRGEQMTQLFEDPENGGYYMTAHDAEPLLVRPKETYDAAMPSGNSAAAMALVQLAGLTGSVRWQEAADRQQTFLAGQMGQYPASHCYALLSMTKTLYPQKELLCTAGKIPAELSDLIKSRSSHNLNILFKSRSNEEELATLAPFTKDYPLSDEPVYYLCENGACRKPEIDFDALDL